MSSISNTSEFKISNSEKKINNGVEQKKNISTDTDFYFSLIANPNKIITKNNENDSSSIIEDNIISSNNQSNKSASSKIQYDKIDISNEIQQIHNYQPEPKSPPITIYPPQPSQLPKSPKSPTYLLKNNNIPQLTPLNIIPSIIQSAPPLTSPKNKNQDLRIKKIELLRRLSEIKSKGYQLSKDYDFNSSIDEMEYEYDLLKSFADKRNGVKIIRNGLLQAISVVEFLNDKYDPFDFHLSGWSEHISVEIDSWDDVLEEIFEKYKGSGRQMAPEIKLLYLLIASASAFHFTKSYASKLPGLDQLLSSNPNLLSSIINTNKEKSKFITQQELNIQNQKETLKKEDKINNKLNKYKTEQPSALNIKTPDEVRQILNKIHNKDNQDSTTQEELSSNPESTLSVSKRGRKPKPKYKSGISIK
uniref:Uncharacterized protein n=1 Tax=viral metagenome TaxID=1070528 RepID=A0A6C0H796_9ZZZZ